MQLVATYLPSPFIKARHLSGRQLCCIPCCNAILQLERPMAQPDCENGNTTERHPAVYDLQSTCDRVSTPVTLHEPKLSSSFNVVKIANAACNTAERSLAATRDTHAYLLRKERVQECRRKQAKIASFGRVPAIEREGCHKILDPGICLREGKLTNAIRGLGQRRFRKISTLRPLDPSPSTEHQL